MSPCHQGPKEFLDCVSHIRLLSWLLLGAMSHTMMAAQRDSGPPCQPIPLEASCHIADHIEVKVIRLRPLCEECLQKFLNSRSSWLVLQSRVKPVWCICE